MNKLTIYSKMNVYYCDGFDKPKIIANSIKDLFNNKNARDYLPEDKEVFKELKENTYFDVRHNNLLDVAYRFLTDCTIFINKNNMIEYLTKICGFTEEQAKKYFTDYIHDTDNNKHVLDYFNNWIRGVLKMFNFDNNDFEKLTYEERLNNYIDQEEQNKLLINNLANQL